MARTPVGCGFSLHLPRNVPELEFSGCIAEGKTKILTTGDTEDTEETQSPVSPVSSVSPVVKIFASCFGRLPAFRILPSVYKGMK